jgi:hypothetical protein
LHDVVPEGTYLEIRGLPEFVTVSAGHVGNRRSWALPLHALDGLKFQITDRVPGKWELDLRLVTKKDVVVAFASAQLIIEPGVGVDNHERQPIASRAPRPDTPVIAIPQGVEQDRSEKLVPRRNEQAAAPLNDADQMGRTIERPLAGSNNPRQDEPQARPERRGDHAVGRRTLQAQEAPAVKNQRRSASGSHQASETQTWRDTEPRDANTLGIQISPSESDAAHFKAGSSEETATLTAGAVPSHPTSHIISSIRATAKTEIAGQARLLTAEEEAEVQGTVRVSSDAVVIVPPVDRARPNLSEPAQAKQEQAERLLRRGELLMAQGNLVVARLFYQRAADMALASAAIKLAETHDPHEMVRLKVVGLVSDPTEAKRWYQRASALGAAAAEARLRRLENH